MCGTVELRSLYLSRVKRGLRGGATLSEIQKPASSPGIRAPGQLDLRGRQSYRGASPSLEGAADDPHGGMDQARRKLPPAVELTAQEAVGTPFHCSWTWLGHDERSCKYLAVGPQGFCWIEGLFDGTWRLDPYVVKVDPRSSRWLVDTNGHASMPSPLVVVEQQRSLQPFDYLSSGFLSSFGLFPSSIQTFFQEPFTRSPDWYRAQWYVSTQSASSADTRFTYYQWAVASLREVAIAVAYGTRDFVLPPGRTWRDVFDPRRTEPWTEVTATWYLAPQSHRVERNAYALLGTSPGATDSEIKKAYRKLARYLHPDSLQYDPSSSKNFDYFHELQAAYDAIKSADMRATYNTTRTFRSRLMPSSGELGWWESSKKPYVELDESPTEF
jgi:hypothetical protein